MHRTLTLCLLLAGFLTACESSETYELATSDQDFIEVEIDGVKTLMNSRPVLESNYYYRDYNETGDQVYIEHSTPNNRQSIFLMVNDCDLNAQKGARTFASDGSGQTDCDPLTQTVSIGYTVFEMDGNVYCPHLEGVPTELPGTITIEEWTEDDYIRGTFETFSDAEHDYVLSGRFQTKL